MRVCECKDYIKPQALCYVMCTTFSVTNRLEVLNRCPTEGSPGSYRASENGHSSAVSSTLQVGTSAHTLRSSFDVRFNLLRLET